jgi:hypothetical protein
MQYTNSNMDLVGEISYYVTSASMGQPAPAAVAVFLTKTWLKPLFFYICMTMARIFLTFPDFTCFFTFKSRGSANIVGKNLGYFQ